MTTLRTLLILAAAGILVNGCNKKPKGTRGENEVWLEYKLFVPQQLNVKAGTTVTFTNKDNANHTATSFSGLFDSGKITSENSWSFTFDKPGTYSYYCNYHSGSTSEQGYIVVQ